MCLFEGALLGFEEEGLSFEDVEDIVYNPLMEGGVIWSSD